MATCALQQIFLRKPVLYLKTWTNFKLLLKVAIPFSFSQVFSHSTVFFGQKVQSLCFLSLQFLEWIVSQVREGEEGTENPEQRGTHTEIYSGSRSFSAIEDWLKKPHPPVTSYPAGLCMPDTLTLPPTAKVQLRLSSLPKKKKKAWIPPGAHLALQLICAWNSPQPCPHLSFLHLAADNPALRCLFTLLLRLVSRFCPASHCFHTSLLQVPPRCPWALDFEKHWSLSSTEYSHLLSRWSPWQQSFQ